LLVDVRIHHLAIVKRDGCVSDDVVFHWFGFRGLMSTELVYANIHTYIYMFQMFFYFFFCVSSA
jgi:hypothetical protein